VGIASLDVEENTCVAQKSTPFVKKMKLFSSTITVDEGEGCQRPEGCLPVLERERGLHLSRLLPAM
jgi:hypothetical protein